ncbi:prolipoprotein diacylglyceryl transferase family protein [Pengzhenrongella phosphoraccumulans]|uniref:prolipoprotein diacylglyceryl transferase family protein n=1 Tax=Pengzhenrongella phosphoraccumulans TaxID=3114394 RepID=UPI00388DC489
MIFAYLPSPPQSVWHLGPVPIRAYALCILTGIVLATWWTQRRWVAEGGSPDDVLDVVFWAVPFGIVGGRIYHVITDPELYFTAGQHPIRALYIWDGGLGIWGGCRARRSGRMDRVSPCGNPVR